MEIKNQSSEILKRQLNKTKRTMKILTWIALTLLAYFLFWWISDRPGLDINFGLIIMGTLYDYYHVRQEIQKNRGRIGDKRLTSNY